jgi:hypothetical protein
MRSATSMVSAGIMLALGLTACSGSSAPAANPSSRSPAATTSMAGGVSPGITATVDPAAQPAVDAYQSAIAAARNAQRHPVGKDATLPPDADFTKFTFDPFRSQYQIFVWGLAAQGGQYRGTPPSSHVSVTSVALSAKPYPTVQLSDCPGDDSEWRLYNAATGAVQPRATQKVSPPYRSSVTVIFYEKHWGVKKVVLDSSRTCTP